MRSSDVGKTSSSKWKGPQFRRPAGNTVIFEVRPKVLDLIRYRRADLHSELKSVRTHRPTSFPFVVLVLRSRTRLMAKKVAEWVRNASSEARSSLRKIENTGMFKSQVMRRACDDVWAHPNSAR